MPTDPKHSLMDDSEFLAELEKLERVVPRERSGQPAFDASLRGLDDGLVPKDVEDGSSDEWSERTAYGESDEEPEPPRRRSAGSIALAVGGFLLLVAIGAGAAAYVFRDRLALILR
jgi:hypothetical protein